MFPEAFLTPDSGDSPGAGPRAGTANYMNTTYALKDDGSFLIKDYNRTHPFSNFLPGIAGEWGIPLWVFYVNRGQAIASFGLKDKDHSIAEFFPANKAYALVSSFGFRTFLKINQKTFYEPFRVCTQPGRKEEMLIRSDSLEIKDTNPDLGLSITVKYFTLPNTPVAGLVRAVTIKNTSPQEIDLEALDGLARITPFGSAHPLLKDISRTLEAWMKSGVSDHLAFFRLTVDPRDVSHTRYIEGANFNYAFYAEKSRKLHPYLIVDPEAVFSPDTSYARPLRFLDPDFKTPLNQITLGKTPCAFSHFKWKLAPGKENALYSLFGAAFKPELVKQFVKSLDGKSLKSKERENESLIRRLKNNCLCLSGREEFDHYTQSTYLDNVLRGGFPYRAKDKVYYIFSRKHGDLERDYNHFQLRPSCFSEGEANYRDINQNRRMDLFFEPAIGAGNIVYFLNFLKIDGYNPLTIKGEKLLFKKLPAQSLLEEFGIKDPRVLSMMLKGFYLGDFFKLLAEEGIKVGKPKGLASALISRAQREPQAVHREGYWIDHWHYNLDLIESFLYFYPDKHKELFLGQEFAFWDDEYRVKKRKQRYLLRGSKVYQAESVEAAREKRTLLKKRKGFKNFLRTKKGRVYKTNLVVKLLALILNKSATLDPEGIGVEMEADKPGWCDSLNGLPALLGSSLCETLELKRAARLLLRAIEALGIKEEVLVPQELFLFYERLNGLLKKNIAARGKNRDYVWWEKANALKEEFREKTFFYLSGKERKLKTGPLGGFLKNLIFKLNRGIQKAGDKQSGLYFTYFTYTVTRYQARNKHIIPLSFRRKPLPLSLEGVVHALRVEGKKDICRKLEQSKLFDRKLKMYRLNASLAGEPLEIGRSRVFVPGWLENESIWLHMEYKYLLELLKQGFYREFFTAFDNCGVCFFDPQKYGRSPLENSSFIVSSAYPDENLWGKGFVARLSGATAEFLNIWALMCLGRAPFFLDGKEGLCLRFAPILKKEFFTTVRKSVDFGTGRLTLPKHTFAFKLFSQTLVVYHNPGGQDTFSPACRVKRVVATVGVKKTTFLADIIKLNSLPGLREGKVRRIDVYLG